jgi:hypothetical protein
VNIFRRAIRHSLRMSRWCYWRIRENIVPIPSVLRLWSINRFSSAAITSPAGPVVSLTTYGRRSRTVYLAIESIGEGFVRPSRIILWLDDRAILDNPPAAIRRLVQRGLEVKFCENYGPHKKYYPYLQSLSTIEAPLVTADDDALYPRDWLKGLLEAFQQFSNVINCYRAHVMVLSYAGISRYEGWKSVRSTRPSARHVATGVSGVVYPPTFLRTLKEAGNAFVDCCPRADDLWLHVQALRAGFKIRQIRPQALLPLSIPGAESTGLWKDNISGGNDRQIAATYTGDDVRKLLAIQD